jgi:hypothetical protein
MPFQAADFLCVFLADYQFFLFDTRLAEYLYF